MVSIRVLTTKFINDIVQEYPDLESVDLSQNSIKRIENLFPFASLKALVLSHNEISILENIDCLPALQHLDVSNNKISIIDSSVAGCSRLEILDLRNNLLLAVASLKPLSNLPELKSLMLEGNPICSLRDYRKQVARLLVNLQTLDDRPIFLFDRLEQESDRTDEGDFHVKSSHERSFSYTTVAARSSPSPLPSRHLFSNDLHPTIQPEICDLIKQIQLRDMQIASFQKIMQIQDDSAKDSTEELLNRWRKKVYELLVQLESQALQTNKKELEFQGEQEEYEEQLASLQKQIVLIKESAARQQIENELISDRKKAAESALVNEQTRSRALVNRININREGIQKTKNVLQQKLQPFRGMFDALMQASDELDAFAQRMKFALSRIKIYSEMIKKRRAAFEPSYNGLQLSNVPVPSSRTGSLEREIEQLSQERALLLCKVADFEQKIRIAVDTASLMHGEQIKRATDERNSALALVDEITKENDLLQSKLKLKQSENEDLQSRMLAEKDARTSEKNSLTEINLQIVSDMTRHFKETVDRLSTCNQELLKECKDMKALHELDANRVRILEDQLSQLRHQIEEKLNVQTSSVQLLLEKSSHDLQATESENRNLKASSEQKDKEITRLLMELNKLQQRSVQDAEQQTSIEANVDKPRIDCAGDSSTAIRLHKLASLASSLL